MSRVVARNLRPPQVIRRAVYPKGIRPPGSQEAYLAPPVFSNELLDATVRGELIFSGLSTKKVLAVSHPWVGKFDALSKELIRNFGSFLKPTKRLNEAVWITDHWSKEYFHWWTDALPRLLLLRESGYKAPLVISERIFAASFVRDSLKRLGEPVTVLEKSQAYQFTKLVLCTPLTNSGNPDPNSMSKLRDRLSYGQTLQPYPQPNPSAAPTAVKIWVSRKHTKRRRVANEEEVQALLKTNGFQICFPEKLTFDNQMQLFGSATEIWGLHGAGLTNSILAPAGARLVEFRRGQDENNCYFNLANALGLNYDFGFGIPESSDVKNSPHYIPIEEISRLL